jgi:uncharacterized delta-60 repeat protein
VIKNYALFTFCIIAFFPNLILAEQPPLEHWVARYDGPASNIDQAHDIAVDNEGNVYVTGQSWSGTNYDYATVKYDSAGNQLWQAGYDGDGNDLDIPYAIVVDNTGNVYVTGESWGNGTAHDYATIKYNTNGSKLWARRYTSDGFYSDKACALAVDSAGNVYVTGSSGGSDVAYSYATVKYDADGVRKWTARYIGPQAYDEASAIAVDNSGNVYVTGESYGSGTGGDYATVKYNSNGTQLWQMRYTGPGGDYDCANALAVDNSGNVYVTGLSYGGQNSRRDYVTIKYNSSGAELWAKRYDGPGKQTDEAYDLAVDSTGNVYVTGISDGGTAGDDYATIKYNTDGTQLWVARYNGPANGRDMACALAVDNYGNVYVTGYKYSSVTGEGYEDYATIKYAPNGTQLWTSFYNGPANGADLPSSLAIDNSGNVYVTGYAAAGIGYDYATIKYTQHNYCTAAIAGDIDANCKIDFADYAMLANDWPTENDWNDLAVLTDNWLQCNLALPSDCW